MVGDLVRTKLQQCTADTNLDLGVSFIEVTVIENMFMLGLCGYRSFHFCLTTSSCGSLL
jgi:hypothetical protein